MAAGTASSTASSAGTAAADVVNLGSTGSLSSLNPLMIDATLMAQYSDMLQFSPLVAMNENVDFDMMLADKVETEDNLSYTVHIHDDAKWSDGEPITAADVKFTLTRLASSVIANPTMGLSSLVGTDDDTGYLPAGTTELEGVQVIDDKTCTFTFKHAVNRISFLNSYAQYFFILPEHVLKDVSEQDLVTYDWFNAPTVVSGPYICTGKDNDHYVSYKANEAYWKGAPKIASLNIKIVDGAQLLTGLQSGELDLVPPLLGTINQSDYESVLSLPNVDAGYGDAYSVEGLFINCKTIPEKEIRQALLIGLDRQTIIDGLLGGQADLCDGFAVPAGPYANGLTPTAFDAGKAAELVKTAAANGWDATKTYEMYLNSGEDILINAATVAQTYWKAAGINVKINTVDLGTLMGMAEGGKGDLYGVQYTYPPVDPTIDIQYVLGSWCGYESDTVNQNLDTMLSTNDTDAYKKALYAIDQEMQANVPIIDLYVSGSLGAVAKRLSGAKATVYGCLNNVETWTISQ